MGVFHGIARRMELFEEFSEGNRLLHGRKMRTAAGPPRPDSSPCVFVSEHARILKRGVTERSVSVLIRDDEGENFALVYSAAEEIDDFLSGVQDYVRTELADGKGPAGSWLRICYRKYVVSPRFRFVRRLGGTYAKDGGDAD